jgi:hypothetical protein
MNTKLLSIIYLAGILLCSCNSADKNKHKRVVRKTFFDSVTAKAELSPAQVKWHLADTNYFPQQSYFEGDTVYRPGSGYRIVLLTWSNHETASKKYLLVYKPNALKCTSMLLVGTIDIEDHGTDYSQSTVQMFNDYQFFTRNVQYIMDKRQSTTLTVTDKFYQVNKNGGIDQLKEKPDGADVPDYDPGPNLTDDGPR